MSDKLLEHLDEIKALTYPSTSNVPRMERLIRALLRVVETDRQTKRAVSLEIPMRGVFEEKREAESALAELLRREWS